MKSEDKIIDTALRLAKKRCLKFLKGKHCKPADASHLFVLQYNIVKSKLLKRYKV